MERFFVKAGSVNAVRKALARAPGGARVVGRYDRETIECAHTMDAHSLVDDTRSHDDCIGRAYTVISPYGDAPCAKRPSFN